MNKVLNISESSQEVRLKRLYFQSHHRGCKEMDLVLGQYAEANLPGLSPEETDMYEALLDEDDLLIWDWVVGRAEPEEKYASLVEKLRQYSPLLRGASETQ